MLLPRQIRNVALIGFMGTGKTSVAQALAVQLRFRVVDTDFLIEARAGKRIQQIFREEGEAHFRQLEAEIVRELQAGERSVIATGGGLGANLDHLRLLKRFCLVVCLWASPETIWARVRHQSHRPLLDCPDPLSKIRALLAERETTYREADVLMDTELRSVREVASHIAHEFRLQAR